MARKRSRHRHKKQNMAKQYSRTLRNHIPQTPGQPIDDKNTRLYGKFSSSDFDDNAITHLISKCEYIINKGGNNYNKITKLREILNIPQRRLFSTHTPSLSADVSPTSGQEQLANELQTS